MLAGCGCNCTRLDESLDSRSAATPIASSYASSQFSEPPIDTGSCNFCKDSVIARVYEVEWNYTNTFPTSKSCCSVYTQQKTYRVYRASLNPPSPPDNQLDYCVFLSKERSVFGYFNQPCVTPANASARVQVSFGLTVASGFLGVRINNAVNYNGQYFDSRVSYAFPTGWDKNCLAPVTLIRVAGPRRWSFSRPFMFEPGYGSPCNTNFITGEDPGIPETLILRPVPA